MKLSRYGNCFFSAGPRPHRKPEREFSIRQICLQWMSRQRIVGLILCSLVALWSLRAQANDSSLIDVPSESMAIPPNLGQLKSFREEMGSAELAEAVLFLPDLRLHLTRTHSGGKSVDGRGNEVLKIVAQLQPRMLSLVQGELELLVPPRVALQSQVLLLGTRMLNGKKILYQLGESAWSAVRVYQPGLPFQVSWEIPQTYFNPEGQALIGLKLRAEGIPNLHPFEALFTLGEWQKISNVALSSEDPSFLPQSLLEASDPVQIYQARKAFRIDTALAEWGVPQPGSHVRNPKTFISLDSSTAGENLQRTGIRVQKLDFKTQEIHSLGFHRETRFSVQACLLREIDRKPIVGQPIRVTGFDGRFRDRDIASNQDGCIQWNDDRVRWNYFAPECFITGKIRLQSASLGFDLEIPVDINPSYNHGSGEVWARDLRYFYQDSQEMGCPPGQSHLIARNPNLSTRLYQHAIDPMLNLGLIKKLQANISLSLRRPSVRGPIGGYREIEIPYGRYRLRYAAVNQFFFLKEKDFASDEESIRSRFHLDQSAFMYREKIVEHRGFSSIQEEFEIFMWNLREMGNNNILLFEFTPVDGKGKSVGPLATRVFQTPFVMSREDSIGNLIPVREEFQGQNEPSILDSIKKIYHQQLKFEQEQQARLFGKDYYARENNLQIINLKDAKSLDSGSGKSSSGTGIHTFPLAQLFDSGRLDATNSQRLCEYWFRDFLRQAMPGSKNPAVQDSGFSWIGLLSGHAKSLAHLIDDCKIQSRQNFGNYFQTDFHYFLKDLEAPVYRESIMNRFSLNEGLQLNRAFTFGSTESMGWDLGMNFRIENWRFWNGRGLGAGNSALEMPGRTAPAKTFGGNVRKMLTNSDYWIFNPQPLSTGVKWMVNRQFADTQGITNSTYSSNSTNFKIERLNFTLRAKNFEKCLSLRLSPLATLGNDLLLENLNKNEFARALAHVMTRGFFICQGDWSGRPSPTLTESYYIINQDDASHLTATDPYTNLSRPYFIKIRGQADFLAFLSMIHQDLAAPEYLRRDESLKKFFFTETRVVELAKQLSPVFFKRLSLGISPQERDFQVERFSDQSELGLLFKMKNLFLKDYSLRGLRSYPGHLIMPSSVSGILLPENRSQKTQ